MLKFKPDFETRITDNLLIKVKELQTGLTMMQALKGKHALPEQIQNIKASLLQIIEENIS